MTARVVLTQAAKIVGAELKASGYAKNGLKFIRSSAEVRSLIELQLSRSGSKDELTYLVNYGVVVVSLSPDATQPTYTECHWARRVTGSDGVEALLLVRQEDSPDEVAARLRAKLREQVLGRLDELQTEAALIEVWMSGKAPGIAETKRLLYLGMLLHRAGRYDELKALRAKLEAGPHDAYTLDTLERLKSLEC